MNDKRPVNLDIGSIRLPITAYVSILHRVSGVVLLVLAGVGLWMLDLSLSSEAGFAALQGALTGFWVKLVLWALIAALAYHLTAGIRHLVMDMGIGETLRGGVLGARLVLVISVVLTILAGVWLWR
ncbi:MAG: succinate dehydrogenase, cytochrome b556 subunit [Pseudomonadales bacterium]|nr:succinate dehydrogenase, cytochrome b556 subunit [Pseudomonadales bacterium]